MKRNFLIIGAVAVVAVIALWWVFLYSPLNDDLSSAQAETASAQKQTQDLQTTLAQLESAKKNLPEKQALLNKLDQAVPKTPDLAEFIIQANDIADQAGIDFLSISPGQPTAGSTGVSTISLTITLNGSFFQLQDYLQSLENLSRLVVVDSINVSAGATSSSGSTGSTTGSSSGSGALGVTLTGRMFTRAAPTATTGGTGTTTPSTGSSSSTTTPASGSSSTTAPATSSTSSGGA